MVVQVDALDRECYEAVKLAICKSRAKIARQARRLNRPPVNRQPSTASSAPLSKDGSGIPPSPVILLPHDKLGSGTAAPAAPVPAPMGAEDRMPSCASVSAAADSDVAHDPTAGALQGASADMCSMSVLDYLSVVASQVADGSLALPPGVCVCVCVCVWCTRVKGAYEVRIVSLYRSIYYYTHLSLNLAIYFCICMFFLWQ